mmetsp:Transcript_10654/g.23092  ORF Transcript_10654/g.23092 Transcript_10654/m.23092 type:complete len:135 (-) Transcript_10654:105-509(-)
MGISENNMVSVVNGDQQVQTFKSQSGKNTISELFEIIRSQAEMAYQLNSASKLRSRSESINLYRKKRLRRSFNRKLYKNKARISIKKQDQHKKTVDTPVNEALLMDLDFLEKNAFKEEKDEFTQSIYSSILAWD